VAGNRPEASVARGDTYYYLDRFAQAQKAYQDALQVDPRNAQAQLGVGQTLYAMYLREPARYDEALQALQKAKQMQPRAETTLAASC